MNRRDDLKNVNMNRRNDLKNVNMNRRDDLKNVNMNRRDDLRTKYTLYTKSYVYRIENMKHLITSSSDMKQFLAVI